MHCEQLQRKVEFDLPHRKGSRISSGFFWDLMGAVETFPEVHLVSGWVKSSPKCQAASGRSNFDIFWNGGALDKNYPTCGSKTFDMAWHPWQATFFCPFSYRQSVMTPQLRVCHGVVWFDRMCCWLTTKILRMDKLQTKISDLLRSCYVGFISNDNRNHMLLTSNNIELKPSYWFEHLSN